MSGEELVDVAGQAGIKCRSSLRCENVDCESAPVLCSIEGPSPQRDDVGGCGTLALVDEAA